jgi:hypothetical protein
VRVTLYSLAQVPGVVASAKVGVTLVSHASVAVGVVNEGVAGHSIVVGPGSAEITGAVVSATLMVWVAVELFPLSSVAVQVRTCTTGQVPVLLSTKVNVTLVSQLSVAVGVVKLGVAGHSIVLSAGSAEITGAVLSSARETVFEVTDPQALDMSTW